MPPPTGFLPCLSRRPACCSLSGNSAHRPIAPTLAGSNQCRCQCQPELPTTNSPAIYCNSTPRYSIPFGLGPAFACGVVSHITGCWCCPRCLNLQGTLWAIRWYGRPSANPRTLTTPGLSTTCRCGRQRGQSPSWEAVHELGLSTPCTRVCRN